MRYLGLDLGARKIGVSVGELIASELSTLRNNKGENFYEEPYRDRAIKEISNLIAQEEADAVVVGLPVSEEGDETEESKKVRGFAEYLEEKLNITVHLTNETLTSFMAQDILESQGLSPQEIEEREDQLAATLILQQFIEENATR
jgi:putative Holliday junction resolvase